MSALCYFLLTTLMQELKVPNIKTFMQFAIHQAELAGARGEVPVGAVIVHEGTIISQQGNRTRELCDPTAHAEILTIREAGQKLNSQRLAECDLYVTLEPCAMCAGAISFARIRRLYYGASDMKGGGIEHGGRFFAQQTCHHAPEVYNGIDEKRCAEILTTFFKQKRA
jgi:tRNA(adenine34) deaminase